MGNLRITLKKSTIKCKEDQKATVAALGLRKVGQVVEQKDNVQIRGMVSKVAHLVQVEEI
ncbi:MAG: 50S ribosomal protein L30 [Clostridia bacterium]|nr:50S ribosomal protein L30 [Clostridia bacterium]